LAAAQTEASSTPSEGEDWVAAECRLVAMHQITANEDNLVTVKVSGKRTQQDYDPLNRPRTWQRHVPTIFASTRPLLHHTGMAV